MIPDATHPLDSSSAAGRLAVLRVLCGGMAGGLVVVAVLIVMVVQFALDGQPIAGNAVQVAGVSVVTLAAVALAVAAPVVGWMISSAVQRSGLGKLAADTASSEPDLVCGKLLDVFAAVTFVEFAVAEGA